MTDEIVIVGADMDAVMALAVAFHGMRCAINVSASERPMKAAARLTAGRQAASIVWLTGSEDVVEVRSFLASRSGCATLLLAPSMPPSAALARVVRTHDADIIGASESPVVIAAKLVAMRMAMGARPADAATP